MFDRAVVLLLDKRAGQKNRLEDEFSWLSRDFRFFGVGDGSVEGFNYDRIDTPAPKRRGSYPAWLERPNSYNAFCSFREIISLAKLDKVESLLLLEDDASLVDGASLEAAMEQLPADWRMFYLGANHTGTKTKRVGDNLLSVNRCVCFHAVALNARVFDEILALPMRDPIDAMATRLHPQGCYAAWPQAVLPLPGFSHCEGRGVDYAKDFVSGGF